MKKLLSILIAVTLISSSCIIAFAQNNNNADTSSKLDNALIEKLEQSDDDDIISVWVWFKDFDKEVFENAKANARESSGFDAKEYSFSITDEEKDIFENSNFPRNDAWIESFNSALKSYSERTSVDRDEYNKKFRNYQSSFRHEMSEIISDRNKKTTDKIKINDSNTIFLSSLSPSGIFYITKSKILEICKNDDVQFIDYYDEQNLPQPQINFPNYDDYINSMHYAQAKELFNASGDNVKILMNDLGLIQNNSAININIDVINPDKVKNIYNHNIYPLNNTIQNYTPPLNNHCILSLNALQYISTNADIFCTELYCFSDIEWALTEENIDIINASTNYGSKNSYYSDSYSKWFDYLSSNYDVPLIASSGNNRRWAGEDNFPLVISPASGFNSIAVGSCDYDDNNFYLKDYCYAQANLQHIVHFKPDLIVCSPDTSRSAPILSGAIALILEKFPTIKGKPELIKAIVMASCHKKALPPNSSSIPQEYMYDGLTLRQGAGVFDAYTAICIAALGNYGTGQISEGYEIANTITPYSNSNINVSLVWFRNNTVNSSTLGSYNNVTIEDLNHLGLSIYNENACVKSSDYTMTYKQLTYFPANKNTQYNVKVSKPSNTSTAVEYAYAWSSEATKCINNVEINGNKTAVGQPLTARTFYLENNEEVSTDELQYQWQKSSNCSTWDNITSANSPTYVLSESDQSNYIRCVVSSKSTSLSNYIKYYGSVNDIVVRYGDVNNDTVVDILDVTKIQKHLAELINLTDDQKRAGDVDGDGFITNNDAQLIYQYCIGNITSFAVENP